MLAFLAIGNLYAWPELAAQTTFTPRWPVAWLRFVDPATGIALILWLHLAAGLAGVALARHRLVRVLVFVSTLELLAFKFSFGAVNHGDHLGVLLAFALIFLPEGWHRFPTAPRQVRAATLLVVSACQGLIMLIYTMSGIWKVGGVFEQLIKGEPTYVSPTGLARQIAAKLLADDGTSPLGPFLIEHHWLAWLLMLAALYLELFALWAAPRPALHRLFGMGLILLHVGTHLSMGVGFAQNSLWLALFLVFSPFRPEAASWRRVAEDLPVLGRWVKAES